MKKYFIITISIILIALLVKLGLYSYYTEPAMLNITRYKLQDEQLSGIKIPRIFTFDRTKKKDLTILFKLSTKKTLTSFYHAEIMLQVTQKT